MNDFNEEDDNKIRRNLMVFSFVVIFGAIVGFDKAHFLKKKLLLCAEPDLSALNGLFFLVLIYLCGRFKYTSFFQQKKRSNLGITEWIFIGISIAVMILAAVLKLNYFLIFVVVILVFDLVILWYRMDRRVLHIQHDFPSIIFLTKTVPIILAGLAGAILMWPFYSPINSSINSFYNWVEKILLFLCFFFIFLIVLSPSSKK